MTAERLAVLDGLEALPAAAQATDTTFEAWDRIVELAARIFDVPMVGINLLRGDIQVTAAGLGAIGTGLITPRQDSFCAHTIGTSGPLVVSDARTDSRFAANPSVTGDPNIRFYAGQPLAAPTGERIGAICLVDDRPRELTDDQIDLLRLLADWVERELAMQDELDRVLRSRPTCCPQRRRRPVSSRSPGCAIPHAGSARGLRRRRIRSGARPGTGRRDAATRDGGLPVGALRGERWSSGRTVLQPARRS